MEEQDYECMGARMYNGGGPVSLLRCVFCGENRSRPTTDVLLVQIMFLLLSSLIVTSDGTEAGDYTLDRQVFQKGFFSPKASR